MTRKRREEAKEMLSRGIDPMASKREAKAHGPLSGTTFGEKAKWVSAYYVRVRSRVDSDVMPYLGDKDIATITRPDVLATVRKIEDRGAVEMGRRIKQTISQVFRFAIAERLISADPARDIGAALAPKPQVKHRTAIAADELGPLLTAIKGYSGDLVTRGALSIVIHTFVRATEATGAQWAEIEGLDGKEPLWRIPAERMKMRRDHIVPLSRQAASILKELRSVSGETLWLFPSPNDGGKKPLSGNALIFALYRMGYHSRATVHGFRTTASTWLNEHEFNRDWIELQLAHVDSSVRGVYNTALYLRQRREMMQAWSDFLEPDEPFADLLG